ncbi:MAG: aminotransferase class I/II-fold pyridoxal phosphate-dependent enzyme [Acidimicrobiia bacterium]
MTLQSRYQPRGSTARQISDDVEEAIRRGRLRPGEQLPPVRSLAGALSVSPGTVAAAYRQLRERGLLVGEGRRGTIVTDRPPVPVRSRLVIPAGVRDLAAGNPDPDFLPDPGPLWASAIQGARMRLYGQPAKDGELVAVVGVQFERDGIPVEALAAVGGAMDGVERVLGAHLRPGDRVAVEDPGYTGVLDLVPALGLTPVPVPVDEFGLIPEALKGALDGGISAVVLTPRAQNPTGARLDERRAGALHRLLAAHPDVLMVEDDHAGPVSGAPPFSTCRGLSRFAVIRSFSKSLGPDLRLAVLTGDATTVARVEGRQALGTGWVSHLLQHTVAGLLAQDSTTTLLAQAEEAYRRRREAMLAALAAQGLSAHGRSGLNVWVPVPEEQAVIAVLLEAGFAVAAGAPYRRRTPPAVRVTTSTIEPGEADAIATALAGALRSGGRTRSA